MHQNVRMRCGGLRLFRKMFIVTLMDNKSLLSVVIYVQSCGKKLGKITEI